MANPAEQPTPTTPAAPAPTGRGRVRLRRAALMAIPACVAAGALVTLTAQNVLATQFSISGMAFEVTADRLDGKGFEQFGTLDNMIENSPNAGDTGGQLFLVRTVVKTADLTNLCQSVNLGGINLLITAGDRGTPVHAENLTTDSDLMSGDAEFHGLEVGRDASTFDKGEVPGPPGMFGQQGDTVAVDHFRQQNYATTAGTFRLPNMHLSFSADGC
ncbi:DUF6230 family protein [Kitasatospora sp. NPDC049285]|uniref:DUF6230 family protein n=1 Tax=Kitasatospora sp. NPDC049285 TaxID=3157096 RepID=UPI0034295324